MTYSTFVRLVMGVDVNSVNSIGRVSNFFLDEPLVVRLTLC